MSPHDSGISEFFLNTDSSQTGPRLDNGLLFSHRTLDIPKKSAFQLLISREFECPTTHSRRSTAGSKGLPTHANERPPGSVSQYPSPPLPGVLTICHLGGNSFDRVVVILIGLSDAGVARLSRNPIPTGTQRWVPMGLCHDVAGSDHPWRNRPFQAWINPISLRCGPNAPCIKHLTRRVGQSGRGAVDCRNIFPDDGGLLERRCTPPR